MVIVLVFSVYFYRSLWAAIPLCGIGLWYWKRDSQRKAQQDRHQLLLQFRDMIRSVAGAMQAGYSVENAFLESYEDMSMMYGRESMICRELKLIQRGLIVSLTMEELLEDLGRRSRTEQIQEFASVFAIARKNGGSMTDVISSYAVMIQRQVDTKEEILTQTAGRRMEQNIMNVMPFGIMAYIGISNRGYFDILYHNMFGVIVMTVCLAVYLTTCGLAEVILKKAVSGLV
ncbi:MAG: type II secretion system F family protein [Lachnospiraceae bacterium]|nr:type II secretion system F family protein [Lachnospiraceae bacterium]